MGNTRNTGYLQNIVQYDASNNITLPAKLAITGTVAINNTTPYDTTQYSLDVNGGLIIKNINKTAQFVLINSNPATGGNNAFVVHTVGGTSGSSYADIQGYYGTSITGSTVLRLNPQGGNVLVGSLAGTGTRVVVADATGVLSTQAAQTLGDLNGVPTSRTITINGTTFDLSANRTYNITSMVYPAAGIAVSTGSAWGTSLTDNSSNWNTAFGWGNHAGLYSLLNHTHTFASLTSIPTTLVGYGITDAATSAQGTNADTAYGWGNHSIAGYLTGITSGQVTTALGFTPYNATNPTGYITSAALSTYATQTYVGTQIANLVASSPAALDTLNELATALGNDASFSTTISTALGNRLRVDINTQGLSATLQGYGRTNLGLGTAATSNTGDFAAASHTHSIANVTGLQTALDGKQASGSYAASSHSHIISDVTGLQTALDGKQASLGFTPYNSTNPSGYISSYTETDTLASVTGRGASTSTYSAFNGGLNVGTSKVGFRNAGLTEFIQGESWATGHYPYNNNDGILFYQRDASDVVHPCFHIGGWNNAGYGGWSNADSMITLVRGDGANTTGSTYASRGLSNSSYYSNIVKTTTRTEFKDSQGVHYFTGTISASNLSGTNTGDQTNISGNAATATTATNFNNGYAYSSGSTVYVDTLESISTTDWLELTYYGGLGVRIGTGTNGSKGLYAGSLYDAGNRVYSAGNPQVNISGNAGTAGTADYAHQLKWYGAGATPTNANTFQKGIISNYYGGGAVTNIPDATYGSLYNFGGYDASSLALQLWSAINHNSTSSTRTLYFRMGNNLGFQNDWKTLLDNTNYSSYALPTTGGTISGNLLLNTSGGNSPYFWLTTDQAAHYIKANSYWIDFVGNANEMFRWYNSATLSMKIDGSNNLTVAGDVTAYSSDRRLKNNIKNIESGLQKVLSLNGVTFDWDQKALDLGFVPTHRYNDSGVIAQEVEVVLPQAVRKAPFDDDGVGNSKSGENYLTVQYEKLVPLFIEAIKEQQTQIESQKSEIDELKDLVQQLINR